MENKNLVSKDLQEVFNKYYLTNDSYLKVALEGLKKFEQRVFISNVLSYEYENLIENGNLKLDEKYNVILPENFKVVLEYDKMNFNGETLSNYIKGLEEYLEREEMELYDDPAEFEGGDYFDGDPDDDEEGLAEMSVEEWVADQTQDLRDFIYALKDFK